MEKKAKEFLEQAGKVYEVNKKKWKKVLSDKGLSFNEDIFNDSIIKTYEAILKREVDDGDYMGYWYKTFLNNTKRDTKYSYHNKDDSVDVIEYLSKTLYEEPKLIDYEQIKDILYRVKTKNTPRSYYLFLMYCLVPNMTYDELRQITGISDVKGIIMRIKEDLDV